MSTNNPSLVVQRLDRAANITVSTDLPRKCLVFPTTGGVQAIDGAGVVVNLAGAAGSLIPLTDNDDDIGSAALRWRAGYFGTSVQTPLLNTQIGGLPTSVMALDAAASAVNIVTVKSASLGGTPSIAATGSDTDINLALAPKGTGVVLLAGSAEVTGRLQVDGISLFTGNSEFGGSITLSGATPTIQATTTNAGITIAPNGTGTINLNAGATGSLQLGGNTAALLGFYGHAATAQQVLATGAGATADDIIAALQALGLVKQA